MSAVQEVTEEAEVWQVLADARRKSDEQLSLMRSLAEEISGEHPQLIIGVNGSIARREMTSGSDVDLFFLSVEQELGSVAGIQQRYRDALASRHIKMPSQGGVFDAPLYAAELMSKIGGEDDTNIFITRRMLYLLEGEWIANREGFERVRRDLIGHYVPDDLEASKLCKFLLNDVIRYWRTICVDFERKTLGATKPRAIRLVKLRFSRMMLYFAGMAAIGQAVNMDVSKKREALCELLALPSIERLIHIFGRERLLGALAAYATFLKAIDTEHVRSQLNQPGAEGLNSPDYKRLIEVARKFRDELHKLLVDTAGKPNDLAKALMI